VSGIRRNGRKGMRREDEREGKEGGEGERRDGG
jgi:hypothetical protein